MDLIVNLVNNFTLIKLLSPKIQFHARALQTKVMNFNVGL